VGISKSFLSIPVYIAQKQGFFSDEGLDVTVKEYSSGKNGNQGPFSPEKLTYLPWQICQLYSIASKETIFVSLPLLPIHIPLLR